MVVFQMKKQRWTCEIFRRNKKEKLEGHWTERWGKSNIFKLMKLAKWQYYEKKLNCEFSRDIQDYQVWGGEWGANRKRHSNCKDLASNSNKTSNSQLQVWDCNLWWLWVSWGLFALSLWIPKHLVQLDT